MKIKYFFLNSLAFVVTLGFSACSKALDMAPSGDIEMSSIWTNNDRVGAYLNTCYWTPSVGIGQWYFTTDIPVAISDDAWDADAEVETTLGSGNAYNGVASAGSHPLTSGGDQYVVNWGLYYQRIRNCNIFLEHIDSAKVTDEKNRERWRAEAHLLRAWYYSNLIRYFGSMVPIVDKGTEYWSDFTKFAVKRSYRELVDFIIADCDTAMQSEEIPWRITNGSESNRVTKALAMAIKSRYSLFAASPLCAVRDENPMTWEEAYIINKDALSQLRLNNYALYKESKNPGTYAVFASRGQVKWAKGAAGAAAYHEYFCTTHEVNSNPNDKETIWEIGGRGDIWYICGIGFQGYYKCGLCPTQELVDQYENVKYNSETADASYPVLDLAKPYLDETHMKPNYNQENPIYDEFTNPYGDRDPRFYASVVYNECIRTAFWKNEEIDGRSGVRYAGNSMRTKTIWTNKEDEYTGIHASRRQRTRTGYYAAKYNKPDAGDNNGGGAGQKQIRLAEIILNTAECAIMTNRISEGMNLINEIRDRVGMPALPLSPSQDQAILYLRHERRVEMAMEETRWDDIRRWQRPDGDLSQYQWLTAMEISWKGDDKEGKPIYTYTRKALRKGPRRCCSNKWLWVPIPLSDQNRLESISGHAWQNPGW